RSNRAAARRRRSAPPDGGIASPRAGALASVRHPADRLLPAFDQLRIVPGAIFGEAQGIEPGAMRALDREMMDRAEARGIIERGDRQVHILAVRIGEAERGAAFAAKGPRGDRRTLIPVRLALPGNVGLLQILERDREAAGGALAHAAVAQIG